jgi:hypothetical protein
MPDCHCRKSSAVCMERSVWIADCGSDGLVLAPLPNWKQRMRVWLHHRRRFGMCDCRNGFGTWNGARNDRYG